MTAQDCLVCQEPVDTDRGDKCTDCREVESRNYAGWSEPDSVPVSVWLDAQSVDQTMRADRAEAPSADEVAAEDARQYPITFFSTLVFAEYAKWREERDASKAPSACLVAPENELTEQIVISASGASR